MAFLVGSVEPTLQRLAVPAVCTLVAFLSYTPQWLFAHAPDLAPGPLTSTESYTFNGLLLCLTYTYYKAITVDPGRYVFPPSYKKKQKKAVDSDPEEEAEETGEVGEGRGQLRLWCKKCAAPKPPRAHHCRTCRRCIPKMDHHCPWTSNCVSLQTFPHFLRFLVFTNLSLWTLLNFLFQRFLALWDSRHLPSYLGPTVTQLVLLTILTFVASMTSLALGILLATTVKGWVFNTTMIESWEIERHESTLERRYETSSSDSGSWWASGERAPGGDRDAPHLSMEPVEFPYDIGIFANMAAAMGTRNPLMWFFPLAGSPAVAPYPYQITQPGTAAEPRLTGWEYEENELNERSGLWPPADPEKTRNAKVWRRRKREADLALERARHDRGADPAHERDAFRRRQEQDLQRWRASRSRILGELEDSYEDYDFVDEAYDRASGGPRPRAAAPLDGAKSAWVNADGEHLGDYGVDEDAEYDGPAVQRPLRDARQQGEVVILRNVEEDEDVPLAELIRRRKVHAKDDEDT
ncbi:zf-DHHC-domain-containing protein [Jackrogersella minutella]|nr:zf-DHHC-domain-containing protein [Jackrogersella minutella]